MPNAYVRDLFLLVTVFLYAGTRDIKKAPVQQCIGAVEQLAISTCSSLH